MDVLFDKKNYKKGVVGDEIPTKKTSTRKKALEHYYKKINTP